MKQSRAIFLAASLAMVWGLVAGPSSAQTAASFPSQPVRIISPFPAGSGPDVVARIVGEKLATSPIKTVKDLVADSTRAAALPHVPTVQESGGPKGIKARC
jgi:tripartite-type tricarboxylate transporter receptor subunit TctC